MKTALKTVKTVLMVLATMIIILAVVRSVGMGINKITPKGGINESGRDLRQVPWIILSPESGATYILSLRGIRGM